MSSTGSSAAATAAAASARSFRAGGRADQDLLGRLDPPRPVLGAADADPRLDDPIALEAQRRQRHGQREIALAPAELHEAAAPGVARVAADAPR